MANDTPGPSPDALGPQGRQAVATIIALLRGKSNNQATVTLTANAASTTVTNKLIGYSTALILVPTTANASAEKGAGTIYQTYPNTTANQAVLNHANNTQTDRTFVAIMIG